MNTEKILSILHKPSELQEREIERLVDMARDLRCTFELGDIKEFLVGSFGDSDGYYTFKELAITLGYEIVYDLIPDLFEPDRFRWKYEIEVRDNVLYFNNEVLDNYRRQSRKTIITDLNRC